MNFQGKIYVKNPAGSNANSQCQNYRNKKEQLLWYSSAQKILIIYLQGLRKTPPLFLDK